MRGKLIQHPNTKLLAEAIKSLRKASNVGFHELAKHLEISTQQLSKYENGKNRVSAVMLWKISKYIRVNIGVFFKDLGDF